jgi:hypothetical protein
VQLPKLLVDKNLAIEFIFSFGTLGKYPISGITACEIKTDENAMTLRG